MKDKRRDGKEETNKERRAAGRGKGAVTEGGRERGGEGGEKREGKRQMEGGRKG